MFYILHYQIKMKDELRAQSWEIDKVSIVGLDREGYIKHDFS